MKVLSIFLGKVSSFDDTSALVMLTNRATGERVESRCDADRLKEEGIRAGDEFECTVVRHGESISVQFVRLTPKPARRQSFGDRWRSLDAPDEDTGDTLCLSCLGSGEGPYSGSRCRDCGGRGEV